MSTPAKKPVAGSTGPGNGAANALNEPRMTRAQWSEIVAALQFRSGQSQDYALVQRCNVLANLIIGRHLANVPVGMTQETGTGNLPPPAPKAKAAHA
jgi:hypothetical protein